MSGDEGRRQPASANSTNADGTAPVTAGAADLLASVTAPATCDAYEGAGLLDKLHAALCNYVVLPSGHVADAVTLWIAATHAQTAWEHAPRCAVVSPEKRCGKSRLMDVAEATCRRALVTVNISPAALVHSITEDAPPTLMIDEADTTFGPAVKDKHEDLRGIINAGHGRGRPYTRYDVNTRRNERLPTFAMAMLAGIGDLPDTIMDRAIVVRMRRKALGEKVQPFRSRRDGVPLAELRDQLSEWVDKHLTDLQGREPKDMGVEDRAADTWEPLMAIADLAGGDWPDRARTAALTMVNAEAAADAEGGIGVRLLDDIRNVTGHMQGEFVSSHDLVRLLVAIEDGPWKDINRGDMLSQRTLAQKLVPYGIRAKRDSNRKRRGYQLLDFTDAFSRYLPQTSGQVSGERQ